MQDAAGGQSAGRQLCSEWRRLLCWLKPLLHGIHTAAATAAAVDAAAAADAAAAVAAGGHIHLACH